MLLFRRKTKIVIPIGKGNILNFVFSELYFVEICWLLRLVNEPMDYCSVITLRRNTYSHEITTTTTTTIIIMTTMMMMMMMMMTVMIINNNY